MELSLLVMLQANPAQLDIIWACSQEDEVLATKNKCYLYLKTKRKFTITGHFYVKTFSVTLGFQVAGKHKNSVLHVFSSGSGGMFSDSGIWPKYSTGFQKTQNFLTGYEIWLLPGKRDSLKFLHGMRFLERKRYSAGGIRDRDVRSSGCRIVVKKERECRITTPLPPPPFPHPPLPFQTLFRAVAVQCCCYGMVFLCNKKEEISLRLRN